MSKKDHPAKLYVHLDEQSQTFLISSVSMDHADWENNHEEIKVPRFKNQYFARNPLCNVLRAAGIEVIEE